MRLANGLLYWVGKSEPPDALLVIIIRKYRGLFEVIFGRMRFVWLLLAAIAGYLEKAWRI
jgi:hypothetical protein